MNKINISKETMRCETVNFMKTLFSLYEVEKVAIKDIEIHSLEDVANIHRGLEMCYHDKMSDVDINIWIAVHSNDYNAESPIYKSFFKRLQIDNQIFGVIFQKRDENGKEGLRICMKSGFRMDLSCHVRSDAAAEPLPEEGRYAISSELAKGNEFWFISIQALAKLLRRDYLIADHLTHMLLMEGLVLQMVERDCKYGTNFHRYGYAEELAYRKFSCNGYEKYIGDEDETFQHIAENLVRAVLCYDELMENVEKQYEKRADLFFEIWNCYIS